MSEIVGRRIKAIRKSRSPKITQAQLAELSGVHRATIASIERGRYASVNTDTILALASALGVDVNEIMLDQVEAIDIGTVVAEFLASDWARLVAPTESEIAWLRSLPGAFWVGSRIEPEAIAEVIRWRRRYSADNS